MQTRTRVILTIFILFFYCALLNLYQVVYSPITGALTAQTLNDSNADYVAAKLVRDGAVEAVARIILILVLAIVWLAGRNMKNTNSIIGLLLCAAALFTTTGCAPYKTLDVVEIKPNETAWVIPLDGTSQGGQVKFNSVDYLNQHKVASKRVMIDKVPRSTGRMYYDIEWIPAVRIIRVDRSLVTAKWADKGNDIGLVTKDSVRIRVGLTVTASIEEDDASKYLYIHGERPLSEVMASSLKSFAEAELTREYSQYSLGEAQTNGALIYAKLFEDAKSSFRESGITIRYLGNAEGLGYEDPDVQTQINKSYAAEQDRKTAQSQQEAQKIRNITDISVKTAAAQAEADAQVIRNAQKIKAAEAEATAAKTLLAAKDAAQFQNELQIKMIEAQAQMAMATKWTGAMPASILPGNSPMLLNLGTK